MPPRTPVLSSPAERALLDRIDVLLPAGPPTGGQRLSPVRVVVPSRSLRLHLLRRVPVHRGRGIAGLVVQTLSALCAELLESAGQPSRAADALLEIIVRRRVVGQPALDPVLGGLDDGGGAVVRPVRDLLAAGFQAETDAVAAAQLLAEVPDGSASTAQLLRAIAVVDVAARARQELTGLGLELHSDAMRRAAALVRQQPSRLGPGTVLLHGFFEATGAETELLTALTETHAAQAVAGSELTEPVQLELACAPSPQAEARQAARLSQAWLAQGVEPEDIGIVVSDASSWSGRLRPELRALSIPWSGVGAHAPAGPAIRRIRALGKVLSRLGDCPLDTFVDALVLLRGAGRLPPEDLRLGLRSLGLVRLRQLAELDVERALNGRSTLPLPARLGLLSDEEGESQDIVLPRRRLPGVALQAAQQAAAGLLAAFASTEALPISTWLSSLAEQAHLRLGWGDPDAAWRALGSAAASLLDRVPGTVPLLRPELHLLLMPVLEGAALGPIGGEGGGVQILNLVEARGRGFSRVVVLGLNRGELPRATDQDPLLPDVLRRRLRAVLPDLPLLEDRRQVEQDHFNALLGCAAQVHLVWAGADDNGRSMPQSPLIEHLRIQRPELEVRVLPVPGGRQDPPGFESPRPPREHLRHRALFNGSDRACLAQVMALGLTDRRLSEGMARVANARVAVLDELDAGGPGASLGPCSGLVGPMLPGGDPRRAALYVTTVEGVASCGWQAFLGRVLRLEPAPDPQGALVGIDPRWVGTVVHDVLERITRSSLGQDGKVETRVEELSQQAGAALVWPGSVELERLCQESAQRLALDEGLAIPGMWRILVIRSLPMLQVARAQDLATPIAAVLGAELSGQATVQTSQGPRVVHFRADRADRLVDGRLRLLDFKTGRPISDKRKAEGREEDLLKQTAAGRRLQAALYARALPEGAVGSYLALRPEVLDEDDPARLASAPGLSIDAAAFGAALDAAASTAIEAWEAGALLPRLVDASGESPPACGWCELRQACSQGDSSARRRQTIWAYEAANDDQPLAQAHRLWWLGQKQPTTEGGGE